MNLWLLLVMKVQDSYSQNVYAAFPRVDPARLQYFEYESIHFSCAGFDGSRGWTVMKKIPNQNSTCGTSWGAFNGSHCSITNTYVDDSGEYWCRTEDGRTGNTVSITVTAGSVILETPIPPVMEGDTVTLRCRNKTGPANISASFYKDGRLIQNVSAGNLTIHSVSKSDEGLYRCLISGGGESAESRLAVTGYHDEAMPFCSDQLPVLLYLLVRTVGTVLWVALLLLVLRRRHSGESTQLTNLDREEAGQTK
ncbi:low affinity immunoglobulin gamma Fc region receptor III-like isoform X2 [Epinephelus fuscoguttatus]|nr:low affinity immunoglobulin gamma Fc region receptor III-like isoform X2 [Epinephelus fuscoguttatus]